MIEDMVEKVSRDLAAQKNEIILDQLNELIKRDLLVIEETRPILVRQGRFDSPETKIVLEQSVTLKLKDQEYIEKLEKENEELKSRLASINEALIW